LRDKIARWILTLLAVLALAIFNVASQVAAQDASGVREIESPAGPASGEPNLVAGADGRVYLSWVEAAGDKGHALRFSVLDGNKWSAPRTIAEGGNWFVNWADFPSLIALGDGTLAAHWLVKAGPGTYAYNVNVALSRDGGRTWSKPMAPHRDGTLTEHGFVSMIPIGGRRVGAVWLDGRKMASEASQGAHGHAEGEMTLRFATIGRDGTLADETLLDGRVCECCQTSAAVTAEGAIVVYRDRSDKEVRDIGVVRFEKGKWTEPRVLNVDGWEIHGCPVNGPSVAADGRRVAAAWFTAAKEKPRVNVIFSSDAGATFGPAIQVDDGSPMGRVQVLMLGDGSALVVWMERAASGAEIRARRIWPDGSRDKSITVAESSSARASGFPRMARAGDSVIFAWTQTGSPSRVRTAMMKLPPQKGT